MTLALTFSTFIHLESRVPAVVLAVSHIDGTLLWTSISMTNGQSVSGQWTMGRVVSGQLPVVDDTVDAVLGQIKTVVSCYLLHCPV